jgi:hypothetical protein
MYLGRTNNLNNSQKFKSFDLRKFVIILLLFISGQLAVSFLFNLQSFVISRGDSTFYFTAASHATELSNFERLYSGYIFSLRLSQIISSSGIFMVVIQAIFVIVASYSMFSLAKDYGGLLAGWVSVSFYLLAPMLSQWTRYILTESIFYSLIVIGLRIATLKHYWNQFAMIPLLLLLILLRPNGVIVACAILSIYVFSKVSRKTTRISLVSFIWIIGLLFSVNSISGDAAEESVQSSIFQKTLDGNVVYGVQDLNYQMPIARSLERSTAAYIKYVIENPIPNLKIGTLRVFWELKQVRPWYSPSLNLFLYLTMGAFYIFSLFGLIQIWREPMVRAIAMLTLPLVLLIAITWAIWEGRFGWWFMVTWIPLFGIGVAVLARMIFLKGKSGRIPTWLEEVGDNASH